MRQPIKLSVKSRSSASLQIPSAVITQLKFVVAASTVYFLNLISWISLNLCGCVLCCALCVLSSCSELMQLAGVAGALMLFNVLRRNLWVYCRELAITQNHCEFFGFGLAFEIRTSWHNGYYRRRSKERVINTWLNEIIDYFSLIQLFNCQKYILLNLINILKDLEIFNLRLISVSYH